MHSTGANPERQQTAGHPPSVDINTQPLASSGVDSVKSIQYIPDQTMLTHQNQQSPNVAIQSGTQNMGTTDGGPPEPVYADMQDTNQTNPTLRRPGNKPNSSVDSPSKSVELNTLGKNSGNLNLANEMHLNINEMEVKNKLEMVGSEATKSMDYASG